MKKIIFGMLFFCIVVNAFAAAVVKDTEPGSRFASTFNPDAREGCVFFKIYLGTSYSLLGDERDMLNNWNKQSVQGSYSQSSNIGIGILGGGEIGYMLDRQNALSAHVGGYQLGGISFGNDIYSGINVSERYDESMQSSGLETGLNYYRYFPDSSGQWFCKAGAGYYNLIVNYTQGLLNTSAGVTQSVDADIPGLSGSTIGGTLGFGREIDLDWFSFCLSANLRYAVISKITGPYKNSAQSSVYLPASNGEGSLVVLPGGLINLVDNNAYNPSIGRYAVFDLSGAELRLDINIWF